MDEKIEIITKYHNKPPRADGKKPGVDYVERTVTIRSPSALLQIGGIAFLCNYQRINDAVFLVITHRYL